MVFKKAKMLARIEKAGLLGMVDDEAISIMDKLDGREVKKNDFKALVYDQEEYYVTAEDGTNYPVNINDCE